MTKSSKIYGSGVFLEFIVSGNNPDTQSLQSASI